MGAFGFKWKLWMEYVAAALMLRAGLTIACEWRSHGCHSSVARFRLSRGASWDAHQHSAATFEISQPLCLEQSKEHYDLVIACGH